MPNVARVQHRHGSRSDESASLEPGLVALRYYAFLSYSHVDQATAAWLHDALEKFRTPSSLAGRLTHNGTVPTRLSPVFRDRQELPASDDLADDIREALDSSRFLVVLCSRAAAKSRWVNAEIDMFKRHRPDGCVLAAIVDGEPFASDVPGGEAEECLPPALRFKYDRRGRPTSRRAEPLAADLRDGRGGRRIGFLKLVAGMLGVGLDDLVQRDTLRRHRRLAMLAAASIAGMVVTTGLAIAAFDARDAARDERREAEGLIGFMLGDLRQKLEPVGRLDALDGVGSRVLNYYQKQDASELSDAALSQRSGALSLMGEVARLRGDLDGALRLYRAAMAGTAEAVRRRPDDGEQLFDHAQNVFWIGEIARQRGRAAAEPAFREYKRLADRLVLLGPDNLKWRMEVQYAQANLGIVLLQQRRFAEAAKQFGQALATIEAVAAIDPQNPAYQTSAAETLAWLADAERDNGRLDQAIAHRERQVALLNRLIRADGSDVKYRQKAIPAEAALGRLYASTGRLDAGLEHLRIAVGHAQRLIPAEPGNRVWIEFAATARLGLAEHLLAAGDRERAAAEARAGCQLVERLIARDSSVVQWRVAERSCVRTRARLALTSGAPDEALALAQRAMALARGARSPDSIQDRYVVANAARLVGDVHQSRGDRESALAAWHGGLAMLPREIAERPWEVNERAELLRRLGRGNEAAPLAAKLAAIGFKTAV